MSKEQKPKITFQFNGESIEYTMPEQEITKTLEKMAQEEKAVKKKKSAPPIEEEKGGKVYVGVSQRADVVSAIRTSKSTAAISHRDNAVTMWTNKQGGKVLKKWLLALGKTPQDTGHVVRDCKVNRAKLRETVLKKYDPDLANRSVPEWKVMKIAVESYVGHESDDTVRQQWKVLGNE